MLKTGIFLALWKNSRNYSHKFATNYTLYDVLKLDRNCTADEIRHSYLKLSKQFHPDVIGIGSAKTNLKNAEKFIKITEAYQVLSKKTTRDLYDVDLYTWEASKGRNPSTRNDPKNSSSIHEPWRVKPNYDPNYNPNEYYGMKDIGKVSNMRIVVLIALFVFTGSAFEFLLVRNSFTLNRERLDDLSKEANSAHANIRADAEKYGNEKQIERMVEKMLKKI